MRDNLSSHARMERERGALAQRPTVSCEHSGSRDPHFPFPRLPFLTSVSLGTKMTFSAGNQVRNLFERLYGLRNS